MLADIFTGEVDAADVFFLIGTILFVVAALISIPRATVSKAAAWASVVGFFGLACVAFALLLL